MLIILITKGIKYIYNARYHSNKLYFINITQWISLQKLYNILTKINDYICKNLNEHNQKVQELINNYFKNNECVTILFQYMSDFISINNKRKEDIIYELIN